MMSSTSEQSQTNSSFFKRLAHKALLTVHVELGVVGGYGGYFYLFEGEI